MDDNTRGHRDPNHEEGQPSRMHTVEVDWTQKVKYNSIFELLNLPRYMGGSKGGLDTYKKGYIGHKA
jgi:hypothetical protein